MKTGGLGRGLGAILGDVTLPELEENKSLQGAIEVKLTDIDPNKDQPRKQFDEEKLQELASSIKTCGIIQPLVVSKKGDRYVIVAGERRWRAARIAGLTHVPVVIRNYTQDQLLELALIENLQRDDLNPMEEALGLRTLIDMNDFTQEELAERLGRSRPAIANSLRLLSLSEPVQNMIKSGQLTAGHGRALLGIDDPGKQLNAAFRIRENQLSVREAEDISRRVSAKKASGANARPESEMAAAEGELERRLGTKVRIVGSAEKGKVTISYYSADQLQSIYDFITDRSYDE